MVTYCGGGGSCGGGLKGCWGGVVVVMVAGRNLPCPIWRQWRVAGCDFSHERLTVGCDEGWEGIGMEE